MPVTATTNGEVGTISRFKVSMMLADAAQAVEGKLYVLGGGWSQTGPGPVPFAIAMDIKVPWEMANRRNKMRLELVDGHGRTVVQETPDGSEKPVLIEPELEVGRPPGLQPGTPLDVPFAINFPNGIQLEPGTRYEWRLMINDDTYEDWSLAFSVRPMVGASAEPL